MYQGPRYAIGTHDVEVDDDGNDNDGNDDDGDDDDDDEQQRTASRRSSPSTCCARASTSRISFLLYLTLPYFKSCLFFAQPLSLSLSLSFSLSGLCSSCTTLLPPLTPDYSTLTLECAYSFANFPIVGVFYQRGRTMLCNPRNLLQERISSATECYSPGPPFYLSSETRI